MLRLSFKNNRKFFSQMGNGGWQNFKKRKKPLFAVQGGSATRRSGGHGVAAVARHHPWPSVPRTHRDGRRRRRYGGGTSTKEVEVGAVHTFGHHIRPCPGSWNTVEMSEDPALCIMRTDVHRRVTRYGMRGKRVGEARRRRQIVVDVSSDSNGEGV